MLDFYFISDEKPTHARGLIHAGSIENEEVIKARDAKLLEGPLDYYGKLRWSSQQARQKRMLLTPAIEAIVPCLASMLKQAFAGEGGLVAIGD